MQKTTTCKCGCNQKFISSHGKKYATDKCKAAVIRRKKRLAARKPKRFCIHCKKLIPQKQTLRRPVCLALTCMDWWKEEEAPRRQTERNRVWSRTKRKAGGQKKPRSSTHKVKEAVKHFRPDDWSHKKWAVQKRELRKLNGKTCVVCGAGLAGNYRLRCKTCTARADDWMIEAGSDSGGMTGVFRSAAG